VFSQRLHRSRESRCVFLRVVGSCILTTNKQTPWSESASELYRPSDRRLLVPTFADRVCHVVSVTDPYGRILGFETGAATFSFK
jgi:hypothetical protein